MGVTIKSETTKHTRTSMHQTMKNHRPPPQQNITLNTEYKP